VKKFDQTTFGQEDDKIGVEMYPKLKDGGVTALRMRCQRDIEIERTVGVAKGRRRSDEVVPKQQERKEKEIRQLRNGEHTTTESSGKKGDDKQVSIAESPTKGERTEMVIIQLRDGGYTVMSKAKMSRVCEIEDMVISQDDSLQGLEEDEGMGRGEARKFIREARVQAYKFHGCEVYADWEEAKDERERQDTGRGESAHKPWDEGGQQLDVECGQCHTWQKLRENADGSTAVCVGCEMDAAIMANGVANRKGSDDEVRVQMGQGQTPEGKQGSGDSTKNQAKTLTAARGKEHVTNDQKPSDWSFEAQKETEGTESETERALFELQQKLRERREKEARVALQRQCPFCTTAKDCNTLSTHYERCRKQGNFQSRSRESAMVTVVIRNRDKQEFEKCKGCHYYIRRSEATDACDICGKNVRHTPMEYHLHHSAPRGRQQSCLLMYERSEEEREKAQTVATDTVNGEREVRSGGAQSPKPMPPPPMSMMTQLPPFKPTDRSGNRRATGPERVADDRANMLNTLG
jgi:hypothetical protein